MTIKKMTMREYLQLDALSSGRCNVILNYSPFHALHDESEPSEASDIGTAIHDGLLEGIDRIVAIEADDWRTKAAKEAREAARQDGKVPMLARKVAQVTAAITAAKAFIADSEIAGVFDNGEPELTLQWDEGGLPCKARPDWLTADRSILLHVKTTQGSAEPNSWIRNQLVPCGYDVAAAFYARGFPETEQHVFLVIEQGAPYGCSLVGLSPALMDLAASKADRAIRIWQECKKTGKYPAYPSRICYAEPKPWQLAEEEEHAQGGKEYDLDKLFPGDKSI